MRWGACIASVLVALGVSSGARADEKRPVPDYDRRGDDPTTAAEVALWIPKILFAPLWVVGEFVFRRPLSFAIPALERAGLKEFLSEKSDYLIFPTVVVDFGFRPSIGIYTGINNLWFPGHQVRLRGAFGGVGFYKIKAKDRVVFDHGHQRAGIFGQYRRRADDTFGGVGPDVLYDRSTVGRFVTQIIEGGARYDYGLDRPTSLTVEVSARDVAFERESCCGPALFDQIDSGQIARPDGLDGYTVVRGRLTGAVDSRGKLRDRGTWGRAEAQVGADVSLEEPESLRWATYGGEIGGGTELWLPERRLTLSFAALFADPLDEEGVPFNSLVRLGGDRYLRGFGGDALYGRSGAVATLRYNWPIWVYLDGTLQFAVGNTFGPHLEDFEVKKLRLSAGTGISTSFIDEDEIFDLLFGFGTDTFEQGTNVASWRIAFGITDGF